MNFLEKCERCGGHGVIQTGSLAGNECRQCVQGRVLTQEGEILAELIQKKIQIWAG